MKTAILDRTINDNALRIVDSSTMGCTLASEPSGLPGFCRGMRVHRSKSYGCHSSNA